MAAPNHERFWRRRGRRRRLYLPLRKSRRRHLQLCRGYLALAAAACGDEPIAPEDTVDPSFARGLDGAIRGLNYFGVRPDLWLIDDADTREWLAEVTRGEGFTVSAADTLRSARAQLVRHQPDVLLTDLQLPDGNGIELVSDLDRAALVGCGVLTGVGAALRTAAVQAGRHEAAVLTC